MAEVPNTACPRKRGTWHRVKQTELFVSPVACDGFRFYFRRRLFGLTAFDVDTNGSVGYCDRRGYKEPLGC